MVLLASPLGWMKLEQRIIIALLTEIISIPVYMAGKILKPRTNLVMKTVLYLDNYNYYLFVIIRVLTF